MLSQDLYVIRVLKKSGFETFSVYNFSIDYPAVCRVEFNPKSRREKGDLVFHFPDREKVFVSWGVLEDATKRFRTVEEQAEHGIKTVSKSSQVKSAERVKKDVIEVNSHKAAYNLVKLSQSSRGLLGGGKATSHDAYSVHLQCDKSSRYFVIYSILTTNAPEDFGDLMNTMIESFKCH